MKGFSSLLDMIGYFSSLDHACIDKYLDPESFKKVQDYYNRDDKVKQLENINRNMQVYINELALGSARVKSH